MNILHPFFGLSTAHTTPCYGDNVEAAYCADCQDITLLELTHNYLLCFLVLRWQPAPLAARQMMLYPVLGFLNPQKRCILTRFPSKQAQAAVHDEVVNFERISASGSDTTYPRSVGVP